MEWSPDGNILASCSLDGTICFWNCDPNSSQALIGKIERAHSGFIKGLSWDPAGKFLASQSDDGSCIIWNVESLLNSQSTSSVFNLDSNDAEMFKETVLEKIFVNMSKMTFFHRPCWSPDGSILALANATNRQLPVVALVERNNWQGPGTFFVGHLGPVEAVRFNPRLFKSVSSATCLDRKEMVCAVASQDGQVSVWSSSRTSPLIVLQELFEHSVMDLSWTPDGMVLVAVSYDGAAVAIRLNPSELDLIPLSESEQTEHLKNTFGNRSAAFRDSSVQGYLENTKVIQFLRENEQFLSNHPSASDVGEEKKNFINEPVSATDLPAQPPLPSKPQSEQVVNGKKRITPQLLVSTGNNSFGSPSNFSSQSQPQQRVLSGVRLRDEDFLIHRKLLERTGGSLLNGLKPSLKEGIIVFEGPEIGTHNISVPLSHVPRLFSVSIEITNNNDNNNGRKSSALIQFIQNSQIIWKERIRGSIYFCSGFRKYSAYAICSGETDKHSLLVLTASGRRYLPPIALDSRAVSLKINPKTHHLSLMTQSGSFYIWDLKLCKLIFSDSSFCYCLTVPCPVRLLDFDEIDLKVSIYPDIKYIYNKPLGTWLIDGPTPLAPSLAKDDPASSSTTGSVEKLKAQLLNASQCDSFVNERQISELEFELSLSFVNLRNGKRLNSTEEAHFQRTLATYALKLVKENRVLKAEELIEDLKDLKCENLIEDLLKPLFTCNLSSTWQDLLTKTP